MYVKKSSLDFFYFSMITGTKSIEKSRKSEPTNPSDLTWELLQQNRLYTLMHYVNWRSIVLFPLKMKVI